MNIMKYTKKNTKKQSGDTYVYFNRNSIEKRLRKDIADFKEDDKELRVLTLRLFRGTHSPLEAFYHIISTILAKIKMITHEQTYYETIHHVEEEKQKQLWVYRTYLFYTFLYFACYVFTNERIFHEVFKGKIMYRDLKKELPQFKMGLFGSIKSTSDIDVGIQYNGNKVTELNYIIHCLEEMFILFTKQSSLDFDIEIYADLLTIYKKKVDSFDLDSSKFGFSELKQLLPYAFNSILRNLLLRKEKDGTTITFDDFYSKLREQDTTIKEICKLLSISEKQFYENLKPLFNESKELLKTFLSLSYDHQRKIYYKKVKLAEEYKKNHYHSLDLGDLSKVTVKMMCLMADALTYRMESYLCAPTIIHVVRVLQANKDVDYKRKTMDIYCKDIPAHQDPFCSIGVVGFTISLFEQIGYLLRFLDVPKKVEKYTERLDDAKHHIHKYYNHHI